MAVFHPRARFDSYVEGALSPDSRQRIAAHLALCGDCRREVQQRERILQFASAMDPSRAVRATSNGHGAPSEGHPGSGEADVTPVLEEREGVAGWKVVTGVGALGLAAVSVLAAAWIAGDPESTVAAGGGDGLLPVAASPSATATGPQQDARPSTSPAASGGEGPLPDHPVRTANASTEEHGGDSGPAVLSPAGVGGSAAATPQESAGDSADGSANSGVALAGVVDLTADMVTDLRQQGWNVPGLNGLGMHHDTTGWALVGDTAEVVMSLQGDESSMVLHECRSLAEDAGIPDCPVSGGLTGTGLPAESVGAEGQTRELPVGVEMSVLDHGDGTWAATAHTANAAYTVESDLPVERADRVMSLVVISERSRVQTGTAPERPSDRLARGFERLLPWMAETGDDRR
ncbi:zf-HC2 domain-containing protein [Citricoccus nitrophenolicus]|uniref:zf-HC2 domain-containing protein n=1 Tax=Citricoccus nitrophenolicus TaxID=863575 RepID=UPI00338B94F4